jgi:hypothetical protein
VSKRLGISRVVLSSMELVCYREVYHSYEKYDVRRKDCSNRKRNAEGQEVLVAQPKGITTKSVLRQQGND